MKKDFRFREIPYNYTSFSDREIIARTLEPDTVAIVEALRETRVTGRSAKLFAENVGDIFIINRNPYLFEELLLSRRRLQRLRVLHAHRLDVIARVGRNIPQVEELISRARDLDARFFERFSRERLMRRRARAALRNITRNENISFAPFDLVAHATDASDWRVDYPSLVVYPDSVDEIPGLIRTAKALDLAIIPRGGGTGLTGGAVPVNKRTIIINTEKLNRISNVTMSNENGRDIPLIDVEAGAVTEEVIQSAKRQGYIFATDPTSSWASTIGGNIAENAGGKKCVMWGTAIDNVLSFRIVDHTGTILEVRRREHPYRKIRPGDTVTFDVLRLDKEKSIPIKSISLSGLEIRKKGLGKDITNKALGGVPGLQKEGGDGLIISARFIVYKPFAFQATVCLEFFGTNLVNASKAIVDITGRFSRDTNVFLTALEHFDDRYVSAISYRNKSARTDSPKAVLLIDLESNDRDALVPACRALMNGMAVYDAEAFLAEGEQDRERFWADRKNLGAIAKHTNAFKLNEDVVIPIERLPDFADFIERSNIAKEQSNRERVLERLDQWCTDAAATASDEGAAARLNLFATRVAEVRAALRHDGAASGFDEAIVTYAETVFHGYEDLRAAHHLIVDDERRRRIVIATHMHAGDGNVHVNIPVLSNDYLMMREAEESAAGAMKMAVELGGVVSGEHGIGLSKLRYADRESLDRYQQYKAESDPSDLFNPGKLDAAFPLDAIYTPSFNLLELEAFILEATDLKELSTSISGCVRCGKCKAVCNTHYPQKGMFYNPRNKILATGMVIEAVLYDAQTSNAVFFRYLKHLRDIANHCTMCHRCKTPCPVKIDFGEVTLNMRTILARHKKNKKKLMTRLALRYLRQRGHVTNKLGRVALLRTGGAVQRAAHRVHRPFAPFTRSIAPTINAILDAKMPRSGSPTVRDRLGLKGAHAIYSFENPERPVRESVFYFPGCGSERMYSDISLAVLALLYRAGIRTVVPPTYLCCGYPMLANGQETEATLKSSENRVIFHRMADNIAYMGIRHIIVSCGTCFEMLGKYDVDNIFDGGTLIDISEYLASNGLYKTEKTSESLLYHEPCHNPLKTLGQEKTIAALFGATTVNIPSCCGEGGTLALSTPEIAQCMRARKRVEVTAVAGAKKTTVHTSCPSCVQGLSRIDGKVQVTGKSLAVLAAERFLGERWREEFLRDVRRNGVERILL